MRFRCLAFRGVEPESFRVWRFTGLDVRAAGFLGFVGLGLEGYGVWVAKKIGGGEWL